VVHNRVLPLDDASDMLPRRYAPQRKVPMHRTTLLLVFLFAIACKDKPAASSTSGERGREGRKASREAPAAKKQEASRSASKKASAEARDYLWENDHDDIAADYMCEEKRLVEDPDSDDEVYPIWVAYEAAMKAAAKGKDGPHFDRFADQFHSKHKRDWIKEQYWPRIKKHVRAYTRNSEDASFIICKTTSRPEGNKFFVKSYDSKKSNPPIGISKEEGRYKMDFFSY
jgi:hypothetical protein